MAKKMPAKKEERPTPNSLLLKFLQENNMAFFIRKQEVRFLEDQAMLIEPPKVIVYYKDQVKATGKDGFELPKEN